MAGGSTKKDASYIDKRMNAVWGLSVKKKDAAIHRQEEEVHCGESVA